MKNYARLTPEGTRDVLFQQAQSEYEVAAHLRAFFTHYGYREVRTPGIEFYDVFGASDKYYPQESMYKSMDRQGRLVVMRPDSTIPIARLVATKLRNRPMPLRLYYDQMVHRSGQNLNGISHEMHQSGIELIGDAGAKSDVEILALSCETLHTLGFDDYRIEIGHVGIVERLLQALPTDESRSEEIRVALEEKNFSRLRNVLDPISDDPAAALLLKLPRLFGGADVFDRAYELFKPVAPACCELIEELADCYRKVQGVCHSEHIMVDFSLANQAFYYSGLVFRGYVGGAGVPVLSGGRYDHLLDDFGLSMPAIGCGVRVDLLAQVLNQRSELEDVPMQLLYVDEKELAEALKWRRSQPEVTVLALSENVSAAQEEAVRLGASALVVYKEGKIEKWEVQHA